LPSNGLIFYSIREMSWKGKRELEGKIGMGMNGF
jgi:hypothetical protein